MKELHFFVDSADEDMAVLLLGEEGEQKLVLPIACLPGDVCEGDWLRVSFGRDDEKRENIREKIDSLMEDLGDNP